MASQHARVDLGDTFGAGYIGAMITAMLYGLTTLQTYFYYVNYPKDAIRTKFLVSVVWVLDTVHVVLVTICIYHYLVVNFGNLAALGIGHWSLSASVVMNILLAVLVQSFFTFQIHHLCKGRVQLWLISILTFVVVAHFAFGIETVVFLVIKGDFESFQQPHVTLIAATPFAIFAVLSDILIAASLCVLLYNGRTGVISTNALVSTLIIYAVNRCLLTSIVAVTEVIVFSLSPKSLWFLAIDFIIGKLYANSLLASLNSRKHIRDISHLQGGQTGDSEFSYASNTNRSSRSNRGSAVVGHVISLEPRGKSSTANDSKDSTLYGESSSHRVQGLA